MARKYPTPEAGEWCGTPALANDNPWDYLRLSAVWAYPPRFVEYPVRRKKGERPTKRPKTVTCVEIRAFAKEMLGPFAVSPCLCRTAHDQAPDWRVHETREVRIRHTRMFNCPTFLVINRRRFRCARCGCSSLEGFERIYPDIHMTASLHEAVLKTAIKRPFSDAEALLSVPESTIRRTFNVHAAERLAKYRFDIPRVIGVDEVHLTNKEKGNFVIFDLVGKKILDIGEGKTLTHMKRVFKNHTNANEFLKVEVFVQDMNKDYKNFAETNFKNAKIVIDKFHVIALATKCMDAARKGYAVDDEKQRKALSKIRLLFLEDPTKMKPERKALLEEQLAAYERLQEPHDVLGHFCGIYGRETREVAERHYAGWKARVRKDKIAYFYPLIRTVDKWHKEIFNYFEFPEGYNNGFVEALNGRLRHMYELSRNMDYPTLRAKALLRYGEFYSKGDFTLWKRRGISLKPWREESAEGRHRCHGFDPDAFFSDLERGAF